MLLELFQLAIIGLHIIGPANDFYQSHILNVFLNVSSSIVGLGLHLINTKVNAWAIFLVQVCADSTEPDSLRHFVVPVSFKHGSNELSY